MRRDLARVFAWTWVAAALALTPAPATRAAAPAPPVAFCGETWPVTTTELHCFAGRSASPRPEDALDLAPLTRLKKLRQLSLVSGEIELILTLGLNDVRPLAGLHALEVLELGHTTLTDVAPLAALTGLKRLRVHASPVRDVSALAALTAVEELDLSCTGVVDVAPLAAMTQLHQLDLTATPVRDLRPLAALKQLEWLGLSLDTVDPAQVAALKAALPGLRIGEGRRY